MPVNLLPDGPDALVDQGLAHQQNGRLAEAELHYNRALAQEPRHVEALHLLGLVRHQTGRYLEAVDLIYRAIALKTAPCPVLLTNVGAALQESKRWMKLRKAIGARFKPSRITYLLMRTFADYCRCEGKP